MLLAAALAAAGCGSVTAVGDLPPAAEPDRSPPLDTRPAGRVVALGDAPAGVADLPQAGRRTAVDGGRTVAVVSARERVLEVYDATTRERLGRAPAGVGPTHVVAGSEGRVYVVDTTGDGLLVFETAARSCGSRAVSRCAARPTASPSTPCAAACGSR